MTAAPLRLRVDGQRLLPGCSAELPQPTAVVTVALEGHLDGAGLGRVHDGAAALCPEEPLFGVPASAWPAAFLLEPPAETGPVERQLGDWVIALTVALQRWARDLVWRGRVLSATPDLLSLAIPWQRQGVLTDTLQLALRLIEVWTRPPGQQPPDVNAAIRQGMQAARVGGMQTGTLRFAQAALERGIPVRVRSGHVQYGWGAEAERMIDSFTNRTSYIATLMAQNKRRTATNLADAGIAVPHGEVVVDVDQALQVAGRLGWPVVVKPSNQDQGRGVAANIGDSAALQRAFEAAARFSPGQVVVEEHIDGDDHRLLVVGGHLLAAARRVPGGVTGDGVHTVGQLVDRVNTDPRRGSDFYSLLKTLTVDAEAAELLNGEGLRVDSVPEAGRWIALRRNANVSTGGTAEDVTASVHPDNRRLAERAARIVGLNIAGVDLPTTDITRSWREVGGAICEVNAQPGTRVHWLAEPDRDINGEILDTLFVGRDGRIPTAAVIGPDAAAVATVLHRIWTAAGRVAGLSTAEVLQIGGQITRSGDYSGYPGARIVLADPAVQTAIVEMTAAGLAEFGHPCDRYDVVAVLGADPSGAAAEMARHAVDAVVVDADSPGAAAAVTAATAGRRILVAVEPDRHGAPWLVASDDGQVTPLVPADEIPEVERRQTAVACALAWAQGVERATIRAALHSTSDGS